MTPTLEQIWNEFSGKLGQFIRARISDPATAEDLLQDVFVKLHNHINQLKDPTKLQSWIYLITRNMITDYYRTHKKTTELSDLFPAEPPLDDSEIEGLQASFHRMIDSLPEPYREAVVLTDIEGLSQKELSKRLGISVSGAKSRIQRGRKLLKQMLLECCRFEFDQRGKMIDCHPKQKNSCEECA